MRKNAKYCQTNRNICTKVVVKLEFQTTCFGYNV